MFLKRIRRLLRLGHASPRAKPRARSKSAPLDASELKEIWHELAQNYFADSKDLPKYHISWSSRRQKRVLASCNIRRKCVRVARELRHPDSKEWLEPIIFHEMCHAVLGEAVEKRGRKRAWHGPSFKALESRHPRTHDLKLWIKTGGFSKAVRAHRLRSKNASLPDLKNLLKN